MLIAGEDRHLFSAESGDPCAPIADGQPDVLGMKSLATRFQVLGQSAGSGHTPQCSDWYECLSS